MRLLASSTSCPEVIRTWVKKYIGSGRNKIPLANQLAATDFTPVAPTAATKCTVRYQARLSRKKGTHGSFLVSTTRVCFSLCCSQTWGLKRCDLNSKGTGQIRTYVCTYVHTYVSAQTVHIYACTYVHMYVHIRTYVRMHIRM